MLCCGRGCFGGMSKRDYKVASTDGVELEPLGGPLSEQKPNGLKYSDGEYIFVYKIFLYKSII